MRRAALVLVVPFALTLAACAQPAPQPPAAVDTTADLAAIDRLRTDYAAAVNAGDAARITSLYTADAIDMPNHEPLLSGREAILAHEQGLMTELTPDISLTAAETKVFGDWGFDRGSFRLTLTPKAAGGTPITDEGKYLVLLQKQTDGSWKVARAISNSNLPIPGTAPTPPSAK